MWLVLVSLLLSTIVQIYLEHNFFTILFLIIARVYFSSRYIGGTSRIIVVRGLEIAAAIAAGVWWFVFDKLAHPVHLLIFLLLSVISFLIMWYDDYAYLQIVMDDKEEL